MFCVRETRIWVWVCFGAVLHIRMDCCIGPTQLWKAAFANVLSLKLAVNLSTRPVQIYPAPPVNTYRTSHLRDEGRRTRRSHQKACPG
jgi:hypothetical protein